MSRLINNIAILSLSLFIYGCSLSPVQNELGDTAGACLGTAELTAKWAGHFEQIEDGELLTRALGSEGEGKLCQGRVYISKGQSDITLFRVWNSTNPNSQYGNWWAFDRPDGRVADYRSGYQICYQWSPLDVLVSCTLKAGVKVVVGTGQSAKCSAYLTYPVSDKQQVYIEDADEVMLNCVTHDGVFRWQ